MCSQADSEYNDTDGIIAEMNARYDEVYKVSTELKRLKHLYSEQLKSPPHTWRLIDKEEIYRFETRVEPCMTTLSVIEPSTTKEILSEIRNVLRLEGFAEARPSCGLHGCRCHLRKLTTFLSKFRDDDLVRLEEKIAEAEDLRHLANYDFTAAWKILDALTHEKLIAEELIEEFELDPEFEKHLQDIKATLQEKTDALKLAETVYEEAAAHIKNVSAKFYELTDMRKAKFQEMLEEDD
jgi:hypothetical protein